MAGTRQALVCAGANLGDRRATLIGAIERLRGWPGIETLETSSIYETEPVGVADQPRFLNVAIGFGTTMSPEELLRALLTIEREFGRERRERWGPRTLDLDLLAFEGETRATRELELPHPRMLERAFVTVPLGELLARPYSRHGAWNELRRQLAILPPAAMGVRKIETESG